MATLPVQAQHRDRRRRRLRRRSRRRRGPIRDEIDPPCGCGRYVPAKRRCPRSHSQRPSKRHVRRCSSRSCYPKIIRLLPVISVVYGCAVDGTRMRGHVDGRVVHMACFFSLPGPVKQKLSYIAGIAGTCISITSRCICADSALASHRFRQTRDGSVGHGRAGGKLNSARGDISRRASCALIRATIAGCCPETSVVSRGSLDKS